MLGGEGAVMTTLDGVTKKKPAEQSAEQQAAAELVRLAQEQGLSLTGPNGLLKQLTKAVLETALNEEMTEHLGYEKHDPAGAGAGNIRNGTRAKTVSFDAPILQKVYGPGKFRRCEHCAPARSGTFGAFGPSNGQCAVVAVARDVRVGPEVGQVQHD
jgi:hypothetical protein